VTVAVIWTILLSKATLQERLNKINIDFWGAFFF
jgi:hypothetical protein